MVSPQMLVQIEKDNARRKLAQAKKKGIKLDNEQELLDIIKGTPASKTIAPKTQPITKKDIISSGGQSSEQKPQENLPTKPYYKDDVANVYDINQDDIERIRKQWGIK
jgi:BRCT domain type II-containing protein